MRDRTVSLKVDAEITGLQAKLRKAGSDVKGFAGDAHRAIQKSRGEWSGLSTQIGLIGAGMLAASALVVKSFADFDKSMSKVKASGADAADNIDALRDAAVRAGADTQYSAAEAADAITDLAKAGVSAKDILGGGLAGALSLAAAGEMGVKEAAETTSVALVQFGLAGSDASHVADLLAAGAGKAMGEVSDLGMALRQGGLVAHQTGLSIEETVGALSSFAAAGMLSSDAGTSLKTMLQRLTPQSEKAKGQFDDLGISAYDAQGNFVGLADFAGQLQGKMKDLSPEARNAAMSVMFGSDAVRAANVLYEEGAEGIGGWIQAVNDQGFAARQAATLTDNLTGDIERLGGSIETVFIQSGSGANKVLRGMTQSANLLVDAVGGLPAPLLTVGTLLTGSSGIGLVGAAGMMKLIGTISDARDSFTKLGKAATLAKISVGGIGTALALGSIALGAWASKTAETKGIVDGLASTMAVMGDSVTRTDSTYVQLAKNLTETKVGMWAWADVGLTTQEVMRKLGVSARDYMDALRGDADALARIQSAQDAWYSTQGGNLSRSYDLIGAIQETTGHLSEAERQALDQAKAEEAAGAGAKTYADALSKSTQATREGSSALADYSKNLFESANSALKLSGTQIGWEAALDDTSAAIEKNGRAARLASGELDLNKEKGRQNATALNQLASASITYSQNLIEQGASEERVRATLERSRTAFIKQAEAAGMTSDAAGDLADAYGLIPSDVSTNISVTGGDRSATKLALVQAAIQDLPPEKQVDVLSAFDAGGIDAANHALRKINGKSVTTYVETVYKSKYSRTVGRASGGSIFGPGTETSDSIPAMLSNNEHVWSAAEVRGAGGHGQMERMRALARIGALPTFASGGAAKKERASLLADLQKRVRRGEIIADVTSGSGLSVIDDMLEWASNTALSKSARSKLSAAAFKYEARLTALTDQLGAAQTTLDRVQSIYDDVYSSISRSGSSLADLSAVGGGYTKHTDAEGNVWYGGSSASASAAEITSKKSAEAGRIGVLGEKINQLRALGASTAFLTEIMSLADSPSGVEQAIKTADKFLADTSQISVMNSAYEEMDRYSSQAAQFVTESAYSGGLSAAQGVVDSLQASMAALGQDLASSFAAALGKVVVGSTVTAPAKKKALGGPVQVGEIYEVNEAGVESFQAFRPYVPGVVLTASQTAAAASPQRVVNIRQTVINPVAQALSVATNEALAADASIGEV